MYTNCEYFNWNLKDSAADSKLKLLKDGEVFGEEKPGGGNDTFNRLSARNKNQRKAHSRIFCGAGNFGDTYRRA